MELRLVPPEGRQLVQGYGPGGFTVSGVRHAGSILVTALRTAPWPAATPGEVRAADLRERLAGVGIDLLLIGTGGRPHALDPAERLALKEGGMAVEVMTTPAAARTYNILLAEDRRVAAALLALAGSA
jgi:uncharacterized protein